MLGVLYGSVTYSETARCKCDCLMTLRGLAWRSMTGTSCRIAAWSPVMVGRAGGLLAEHVRLGGERGARGGEGRLPGRGHDLSG
jgi:hypothetical protein